MQESNDDFVHSKFGELMMQRIDARSNFLFNIVFLNKATFERSSDDQQTQL